MVLWVLEQWQPLALQAGCSSTHSSAQNIFCTVSIATALISRHIGHVWRIQHKADDVLIVMILTKYAGPYPLLVWKRLCFKICEILDPLRVIVLCRFYCCEYICATIYDYISVNTQMYAFHFSSRNVIGTQITEFSWEKDDERRRTFYSLSQTGK